jgi:hypothetical protein
MRALKALKALFFIFFLCAVSASLIIPASWFFTAEHLPYPIESAADIELHLRQSIESERQVEEMQKRPSVRQKVTWERPAFSKLPQTLVALYITETGCPTYFQTPREEGWLWLRRVFSMMRNHMLDGDGACELIIARSLAYRLRARSPLQLAVAADRIHRFLQKDQLVAYSLTSLQLDQGIIGVDDGAEFLMQKKLADLTLAEFAEFQLALPPYDLWDDLKACSNAPLIRQNRDVLLKRLADNGHISKEMARTAAAAAPRCLATRR